MEIHKEKSSLRNQKIIPRNLNEMYIHEFGFSKQKIEKTPYSILSMLLPHISVHILYTVR
jgi:hypothetical protein